MRDEPVFPAKGQIRKCDKDGIPTGEIWGLGLTKREYFAALAMQGIISNQEELKHSIEVADNSGKLGEMWWDVVADYAIKYADALIAELEKQHE